MAISITCPNCEKKLQAPDTAVGKKVRCPGCQTLIKVPEPDTPDPDPSTAVSDTPQSSKPGPSTGVSETPTKKKKSSWEDDEPEEEDRDRDDYGVDEDDAKERRRRKRRREEEDEDDDIDLRDRRGRRGRGGEAHRGIAILVMGIVTLLFACVCPLICWVLGSVTLNMANADTAKMDTGVMDDSGRGLVTAGKVCAIIGIFVGVLNAIAGIAIQVASR